MGYLTLCFTIKEYILKAAVAKIHTLTITRMTSWLDGRLNGWLDGLTSWLLNQKLSATNPQSTIIDYFNFSSLSRLCHTLCCFYCPIFLWHLSSLWFSATSSTCVPWSGYDGCTVQDCAKSDKPKQISAQSTSMFTKVKCHMYRIMCQMFYLKVCVL